MSRALASMTNKVTGASDLLSTSFGQTALTAQQLADKIQQLNQRIQDNFTNMMNADQANLQWHKDLTTLNTDIDKHGASLDIATAAGQRNIGVLQQLIQDAERSREASIAQAGGQNASAAAVDAANLKYRSQIGQLYNLGIQMGLSKGGLQALINKYMDLINLPNITKHFTLVSQSLGAGIIAGYNQAMGRATGGPVEAGHPYVVGEHHPELFVPNVNGTIVPSVPKYGIPAQRGRVQGGDGGAMAVDVYLHLDGAQVLKVVRTAVRGQGGNVNVVLNPRAA
jgi:hypothetical protein